MLRTIAVVVINVVFWGTAALFMLTPRRIQELPVRQAFREIPQHLGRLLRVFGMIVRGVFQFTVGAALFVGGVWLMVALVKFCWTHS